jgi:iron complex outermembrane receptor protein
MNVLKTSLFAFFVIVAFAAYAQVHDSASAGEIRELQVVEVSETRLTAFSSGNKNETLDSASLKRYSNSNLADLLAAESQVFIKSYGLGSSATTSFRGAGASHTAVLWNGFNIQGPMLSQLDLSLVPVNFLDDIKLQYGGAGALWGSGAVGGTIHINNKALFNKGVQASCNVAFGSFADRQQQLNVSISEKRWISSLKLFRHNAKNDFPFINTAQYGKPEQQQSNAELEQYGLLQENYFLIGKRQKINTRFWYQFNDRNIPPSMTQNTSNANQKDELYRITSEWQHSGQEIELLARMAYFDEYIYFIDDATTENSKSRSKAIIGEAEARFSVLKFDRVNVGINATYNDAKTADYSRKVNQNRTALFANYKIQTAENRFNAVISVRQEVVDGKAIPFTTSIGVEAELFKGFKLKANAARHYRLPSFNDLYWAGVGAKGNPDLKPESGWSEELSIVYKYNYKNLECEFAATGFNRNIDNWIIWLPETSNIWSPKNVQEVWSRGLEYKAAVTYKQGNFKVQLSGLYNYVLSTNEKSIVPNDVTVHKQLIYVPVENAQGSLSVYYKGTSLTYTQQYIGYRYTTSDNKYYLEPYTLGNVHLAQMITLNKLRLKAYAQFNNIWKETYQVIAYRAMPLFNYQFGICIYFR